MPSLLQDSQHALRVSARNRAFSAGMALTVASVIGASTCIFVAVYGLLLRRLPFHDAKRLVLVWEENRDLGLDHLPVTEGAYPIFKRDSKTFQSMAAFIPRLPQVPSFSLADTNERVVGVYATPELFQVLGVRPESGRVFTAAERRRGASQVAVLSHRFWRRHFNENESVVGQDLVVNIFASPERFTIVGIMPSDFEFPYPLFPDRPDVWLSQDYDESRFLPGNNFYVIARLKPGNTAGQAQNELNEIAERISADQPRYYGSVSIRVAPLREESLRNSRAVIAALLAALGFVTLVGISNIAHLAVAFGSAVRREYALRLALGARWRDLLRLSSLEVGVPISTGGAAGLILAYWGVAILPRVLPHELYIPRADALVFAGPTLAFAAGLCLAGALGLGWLLCSLPDRQQLGQDLRGASRHGAHGPRLVRTGSVVLICEAALTFALVSGTVASIRGLQALDRLGATISPERLFAMDIFVSNDVPSDPKANVRRYQDFLLNGAAAEGVTAVALADRFPLTETYDSFQSAGVRGAIARRAQPAEFHVVTPPYGEVVGIEVLTGRWLTESDRADTPGVAVINETMARLYFEEGRAIGARLRSSRREPSWPSEWLVVGVVREPRRLGNSRESGPAVFLPFQQAPIRNLTAIVRTTVPARNVIGRFRGMALKILPGMVQVTRVRTGSDILSEAAAPTRFIRGQLMAATAVALILAALGIFSVTSFFNAQRKREIGLRLALGGAPTQVMAAILRRYLGLLLWGAGIGFFLAEILIRILATFCQATSAADSPVYAIAGSIVVGVGIAAVLLASRHAAEIEPAQILREE